MKQTLDFIIRGSEVTRYHTVRTIFPESVGEHSQMVALLCYLIDPSCSRELLVAALAHDLAEHVLGDIPAPAKRQFGIGEQVNELEDKLLADAGFDLQLTDEEWRILKFGDIFQGMIKCGREISLGNSKLRDVFDRYCSYAEERMPTGRERELFNIIKEMYK